MIKLRANFAASAVVCLLSLVAARTASADSISLAWNSSVLPVAGYAVYVTPPSGTTTRVDVGGATLYTYSSAVAGQRYCFAVSAYLLPLLEGTKSGQVCGYSNAAPTLTNPGSQTSTVGQPDTLQLQGSDPAGQPLTYTANGLPPGLAVMVSTGFISGTPTTAGTYSATANATDGTLTVSQSFTWTISSGGTSDWTAPTASITGPTSATTYTSSSSSIGLSGTAADNVGVTQVSWVNDRGGSGVATGTTSWSAGSIALQSGANRITVTARDAAGNLGTDVVTVTRSTSSGDGTAPIAAISSPTASTSYSTTSATMSLSGTASDNVGVTQVTWANSLGGSGTATLNASGTWTVGSVALVSGSNVITVTARDAAGNQGTDVLTVTRTTTSGDSVAPTVSITGPTLNSTYTTSATSMALSGTSGDNVGVTQLTWSNNRGGSGSITVYGSGNWWVGGVGLLSGSNVITITARDAAGNQGTDVLTVTSGS